LTPMPDAANQMQKVIIRGGGWIDFNTSYTFGIGSEIVFKDDNPMAINGGLRVTMGSTLQLKNLTVITGCDAMWEGIVVAPNSRLNMDYLCELSDAKTGVTLQDNSALFSREVTYKRNYTCISIAPASINTPSINVSTTIVSSKFYGHFPMKEIIDARTYPLSGVNANRVNHVSIVGKGFSNFNIFEGFGQNEGAILGVVPHAISCSLSSLTVRNTIFKNIGSITVTSNDPSGIGILISNWGTNGGNFLSLQGIGKNVASTFENVHLGVRVYRTSATVKECYFDGGITHVDIQPATQSTLDVSSNTFKHYSIAIKSHFLYPSPISLKVYNNTFEGIVSTGQYSNAIYAQGIENLTYNPNFSIYNNVVSNEYSGFRVINLQNVKVYNNETTCANCLELLNCDYCAIDGNSFAGDGPAFYGIRSHESYRNSFKCNNFNNSSFGILFSGYGCDGTDIFRNGFGVHNEGLSLYPDTRIGQQKFRHNTWPSNNFSGLEANFLISPTNPNYSDLLSESKILINSLETPTNTNWANPRYPTGSDWFGYQFDINNNEYCTTTSEEFFPSDPIPTTLTAADEKVIANTMPIYNGYPATLWDSKLRLYRSLYRFPNLRTVEWGSEQFYANQQGTNMSSLGYAIEQYRLILRLNASDIYTIEQKKGEMESIRNAIEQIDYQLEAAIGIEIELLLSLRTQYVQQLTQKETEIVTLVSQIRQQQISALQNLLPVVNTIPAVEVYETNLRDALSVLIANAIAGTANNYTSTQASVLSNIASQCKLSGGFGVLLARMMLGQNTIDAESCGGARDQDNSGILDGESDEVRILPNPANESILVQFSNTGVDGTIILFDIFGRTALSQVFNRQSAIVLDVSNIPNGTYFLQWSITGRQPSVRKVQIVH